MPWITSWALTVTVTGVAPSDCGKMKTTDESGFTDGIGRMNGFERLFSIFLRLACLLMLSTGFWILTFDFWLLTSEHWLPAIDFWLPNSGF